MAKQTNATKKGASPLRIIAGIALLLILGALIAGVWIYMDGSNNGTDVFKTFTLKIDGEKIASGETKRKVSFGPHKAEIGYLFEDHDYDVSFRPREGVSLDYTVDGKNYAWSQLNGLDGAFSLKKSADGFTFEIPETISETLSKLYEGDVECPNPPEDGFVFSLIVSSYDYRIVYTVNFAIVIPVDEMEIVPGRIDF